MTVHEGIVKETYLRLFLYVTEEGLRSIIKEKKIRLSCPWRTNDITEGVARGEQQQNEWIKSYGYVCFSAVCDSPSMWGYYAERGRGACLVFDFPVCQGNEESNEGKDDFYILRHGLLDPAPKKLHKIKYRKNRLLPMKNYADVGVLLTKSLDWQHEKEYRILYPLSAVNDTASYIDSKTGRTEYYDAELLEYLSGIILGPQCPLNIAEVKTEISHSCKSEEPDDDFWKKLTEEEIQWEYYRLSLGLANAVIIRAKLDELTFCYDVPISGIYARENRFINMLVSKMLQCKDWCKQTLWMGKERFDFHYSWWIDDARYVENWPSVGYIKEAVLAQCIDEKNPQARKIGVYFMDADGGRYILPYINPDALKDICENASLAKNVL